VVEGVENGVLGDYLDLRSSNKRIEKNGMRDSVIFKLRIPIALEYAITKTYKTTSLDTTL
jgi:hypothetical protein